MAKSAHQDLKESTKAPRKETAAAGGAPRARRSPEEQAAAGKALRVKVRREDLAVWKPGKRQRDPISILQQSDPDRVAELVPIRYGRMLQSPFAFYRGSAGVMASDLSNSPTSDLHVQACGDCHLVNFGGFATPERNIIFDINDFDETLPAPWDWDVRRLVASIVLAGRSVGLSERMSRDCAESAARSYRERMSEFAKMDPLRLWYSQISSNDIMAALSKGAQKRLQKRIEKATVASGSEMDFPKMTEVSGDNVRISDQPPLIFHPDTLHGPEFEATLQDVRRAYRETLSADRRALLDRYQFVDAAMKVVGIGSVGRRCWIVLMRSAAGNPLFLQFKEAASSVFEPFTAKSTYDHHGERVVMGQRLMQPASDIFLGWFTAPNGRHFYARQLRDAKIKPLVETFDLEMLDKYAGFCGWVLARAHAKASDISPTISSYMCNSSDKFDVAMGAFAVAYADQAEKDHGLLKAAVRAGKIDVIQEAQ